jgi:hypothetical protein
MTGIALCHAPRVVGTVKLWKWALRASDRRGQDKSRKVRTVGWVRNSVKFRLVAHIAKFSRNLDLSVTRYRRSTIDTLRRDR